MMKKFLMIFALILIVSSSACGNASKGIVENESVVVSGSSGDSGAAIPGALRQVSASTNLWIDQPLDGATVFLPLVEVTAHGSSDSGVESFIFEVESEEQDTIQPAVQYVDAAFRAMVYEWYPTKTGWQTVTITMMENGNDLGFSRDIQVLVLDPDQAEEKPETSPAAESDRCELFDPASTKLSLHEIPVLTTDLTFYITFDHLVYGPEQLVEGDTDEWEYSALLGEEFLLEGEYRGYSMREYFRISEFPESWWGSIQTLKVFVNGCGEPIYSHDRVSFLKPACTITMDQASCAWTGGEFKFYLNTNSSECICP